MKAKDHRQISGNRQQGKQQSFLACQQQPCLKKQDACQRPKGRLPTLVFRKLGLDEKDTGRKKGCKRNTGLYVMKNTHCDSSFGQSSQ